MYAKQQCGTDLRAGGGDYELVVTDIQKPVQPGRPRRRGRLPLPARLRPAAARRGHRAAALRRRGGGPDLGENYAATPRRSPTRRPTSSSPARPGWRRTPRRRPSCIALWERGLQEWQATATRSSRPSGGLRRDHARRRRPS
jgi:hypothetical protein